MLQEEAWVAANSDDNNSEMTFELWKKNMVKCSPTFQYWGIVLEIEILVLIFVHARRSSNFDSYIESLEAIVPKYFALDSTNYASWIPIHNT